MGASSDGALCWMDKNDSNAVPIGAATGAALQKEGIFISFGLTMMGATSWGTMQKAIIMLNSNN